ncbi:MAG: Omp28-related outer membrane protein [Saprospiraceae bacterium]|nr:Omp28-related outer membrane protein [Saprospiraceae bacterium]
MTKKLLISFCFLSVISHSFSQAKRYVFMEHFTNTRCGVCAATNPGYYNLLNNYKDKYHHISIHPPIPYSACLLYQANKDDQNQRSNFYGILGTPTIVFNGTTKKSASSVNASFMDAEIKKESPIQILVKDAGTDMRISNIEIKTLGTKPAGKYRIYAAIVERVLQYASPNGEKVHYDVFRDFASDAGGDEIDLSNQGGSVAKSFTYTLQPSWVPNQIYTLVWVQEETTKEILNSGSANDVITATTQEKILPFHIQSNPVFQKLNIIFPENLQKNANLVITNLLGKVMYNSSIQLQNHGFELNVQHFEKGIYFAKIESGGSSTTKKWVKQ